MEIENGGDWIVRWANRVEQAQAEKPDDVKSSTDETDEKPKVLRDRSDDE